MVTLTWAVAQLGAFNIRTVGLAVGRWHRNTGITGTRLVDVETISAKVAHQIIEIGNLLIVPALEEEFHDCLVCKNNGVGEILVEAGGGIMHGVVLTLLVEVISELPSCVLMFSRRYKVD